MIHACQARIVSDLEIAIEAAPEPVALSAEVAQTVQLAPDVVGVDIELPKPLDYLPGQYCKLQFQGFPARSYSPTYPLEGAPHDHLLHFHIRKVTDGLVSSALGQEIRPGHRVKLTGPYGRAFFRQGHSGRIVLVASGTGFAPMWSVAVAAIMEQPQREMVFIVQARSIRSLYMHAALCRLALFPNVTLIPMVSEPQQISHAIQSGRPTDHLPKLSPDDVVYTAGAPAMTDAVARIAKAAGARCYTDPFVQEPTDCRTDRPDVAPHRLAQRAQKWTHPAAAGAKGGADAARRSRGWRRQPLAGSGQATIAFSRRSPRYTAGRTSRTPPWHCRRRCGPTTRHRCGRTPAARPQPRSGAPPRH